MAAVSLAGIGVAAYLTYVHYSGVPVYCTGSGGCHTVQSSQYATLLSVPVATFGLGLYCALFVLALVAVRGPDSVRGIAPFAVFGLALSGTMYSGYLTWLEVYRIYAICAWCVTSASLLATILVLSTGELLVSGRWRAAVELEEEGREEDMM
jgi:uncharacterized membrane protein